MATYTQAHRPIAITTPFGKDVLLLTGLRGQEAISQLFNFQVDLLSESPNEIHFDRIIGQNVTVEMRLPNEEKRYFNGLVNRFSQGARDEVFGHFRAQLVPDLWLLTKKFRSRIFQHLSVPDILRQVFRGLDVTYDISGTYYPRDYCVQYRESDFDFASRLMEEEGIYYYFKHGEDGHQMVTTDVPNWHPDISGQTNVIYEKVFGGMRKEMRVTTWEKSQELRSGEYTLWDHCFELPDKHLEAKKKTMDSVVVGEVTHKLSVGGNDQLKIYEFPGGYAQRFDGIDRSGSPKPQDLKEIFPDSERTAKVRMEQEEVASLEVAGQSNCGNFVAGHKFNLERHFNANGRYLLTRVEHDARLEGNYRTGQAPVFNYENHFTCIPVALPYRPQRVIRKPVIAGIQTATVVGPQGEEIFCDKYGRVKVQFHWDREGKKDADSSCWLRVAQVWAGKGWGAFFWPRVGHEVVVVFEEGDPDQPLIIGSVYNAKNMPPFRLPTEKMFGGFKSASVRENPQKNFNGILFVDEKNHEHLAIHSERHMVFNAEFDKLFRSGRHHGERVPGARTVTVGCLPGGGGSGGGGPNQNLWPQPEPQAVMGLNSTVVYGGNYQIACPLNFQMALGSNLQICVNPFTYAAVTAGSGKPPLPTAGMAEFLGSGAGGNMQLTLGTSTNFVMGQSFDINLGPRKIELHVGEYAGIHPCCILLGWGICALVVATVLAYALLEDDDARALLLLTFTTTMQILLGQLMNFEKLYQKVDDTTNKTTQKLFVPTSPFAETEAAVYDVAAWLSLAAMCLPSILDSIGEVKLDFKGDTSNNASAPTSAGWGGGPDPTDHSESFDGRYSIVANQVEFLSRPPMPPAVPGPNVITLLAAGLGMDGKVDVRGSQGVRITAGPPLLPPTTSDSTNGVEIVVGETQNITVQRGLLPVDQKIELTPSGMTIDAGLGKVTIQSLTQITLSVAGGLSTITLGPEGITIQGLLVKIN
jgi:type VI secretion system secreted protein VgrG